MIIMKMLFSILIWILLNVGKLKSDNFHTVTEMPQKLQNITFEFKPGTEVDTQQELTIIGTNTLGSEIEFAAEDVIVISKDFERVFAMIPFQEIVTVNMRRFLNNKTAPGIFTLVLKFEDEEDADTHWEVQWYSKFTDDKFIVMKSFFVKANIPVRIELTCHEKLSYDCNNLEEDDIVIVTCSLLSGPPQSTISVKLPAFASVIFLENGNSLKRFSIKLRPDVINNELSCFSGSEIITTREPFTFRLKSQLKSNDLDALTLKVIAAVLFVLLLAGYIHGIYSILYKAVKISSKNKVEKMAHTINDGPTENTLYSDTNPLGKIKSKQSRNSEEEYNSFKSGEKPIIVHTTSSETKGTS